MIAFVGRLVRQKGTQYLMAAARILAQRKPDAVLLVVGDGPLHSLLENSASVAGLTNLRFLGEQTDVRPAIAACDMMVVPSEWEPFGIVSLEAMAMKKPVVAFDVDGIPEIIVHGNTGILVEHRNVDALVHALVALAEDPPARERMGESGRERVEEIFDSRATARNFEQIYQSLATRQA
jgi:glycosyltransferase involved in cell wall biosynthesis